MRSCEDGHIGPKHAPVTNCNKAAVQDSEVEVCVEALAERDIASIVDVERRLDEDLVVAHVADDALQHLETLFGEDIEARGRLCGCIWEPCVVSVGEGTGFEPRFVERRLEGVVPLRFSTSVVEAVRGGVQHPRNHLLVLLALGYVVERLCFLQLLGVLLCGCHYVEV
jgi:hypothetical protein